VVCDTVVELGNRLVEAGDPFEAEHLLSLASVAFEQLEPAATVRRARLALALGEARWAEGDGWAATRTFEQADALLASTDEAVDPRLRAAAATAACRYANPFFGDPARRARLFTLDDELPPGDLPERVRLWGRLVALSVIDPEGMAVAHAKADEGIAMARRLGDPVLIMGALIDRFQTPASRADLEARARAAEEILELSRRAGRRDLELTALEWQYTARLTVGDLQGALGVLDELDARARVMPSPLWSYVAATRRTSALALSGDREGALELAATASDLAAGLLPPEEIHGVEAGLRLSTWVLYGVPDPGYPAVAALVDAELGSAPQMFMQVRVAMGRLLTGRVDEALAVVDRWVPDIAVGLMGLEGLSTVCIAANEVILLDRAEHASELRRVLAPFHGLVPAGNGVGVMAPVDHLLARLALLDGDPRAAVAHAEDALELERAMPAPAWEAVTLEVLAKARDALGDRAGARLAHDDARAIADRIGLDLSPPIPARRVATVGEVAPAPAPPGPATDRDALLRRTSDGWYVRCRLGQGLVPLSRGMDQLARLLATAGTEVSAVELAGMAAGGGGAVGAVAPEADLGPVLDARAKRAYRARITDLQEQIDEADARADLERAGRARIELDLLLDELRRATGIGGRDRPTGSGAERARVNVARSLRRAVAAVEAAVPDLGSHLRVSVRTGRHCAYDPEPAAALRWAVTTDEPPGRPSS
jgi:hypothetical protein